MEPEVANRLLEAEKAYRSLLRGDCGILLRLRRPDLHALRIQKTILAKLEGHHGVTYPFPP